MNDVSKKTIGIFLPDGFADWEYGLLAASAAENLSAKIIFLTDNTASVRSIGGLLTKGERDASVEANTDLDALAIIGSDIWRTTNAPQVGNLLQAVAGRGGTVGAICGATVVLAKSGLLAGRRHTSNGKDWLLEATGGYIGQSHYADQAAAVRDGAIISASGLAPDTFAIEFLGALYPEASEMLSEAKNMFAGEHRS